LPKSGATVTVVGGDGVKECDLQNIDDEIFADEGCLFPEPEVSPRHGPQCGYRNSNGIDDTALKAQIGQANYAEWPHVCAILKNVTVGLQDDVVQVYLCGASLITPQVVLTSAHCVNDTNALRDILSVRCGEWDTQTTNELYPYQEQKVFRIEKHPDTDAGNHHNNFALLYMSSAFDTSLPHIKPTCLPKPGEKPFSQFCVSHGWGKDKFGSVGKYQEVLKEVIVPIVKNDVCEADLRETRLGEYFELHSSFICAGGIKGVDTCKGDGGAPLVCQQEPQGTWYQAGIVSWGIGCGEDGVPTVYADVSTAACWIDEQVSAFYGSSDSYFGFDDKDC